jgi:hypothetical protein
VGLLYFLETRDTSRLVVIINISFVKNCPLRSYIIAEGLKRTDEYFRVFLAELKVTLAPKSS